MDLQSVLLFLGCLVASFGLPFVLEAPYASYQAAWYKNLRRPRIALPDPVFIVIFPVFYFLEAIGLYLLLTSANDLSLYAYGALFLLSAALSGIWSRLFFVYKRCDLSLIAFFLEIPVSVVFVYLLAQESHAAWLFFLPRTLWGFYAIWANIGFYRLNKAFWASVKR